MSEETQGTPEEEVESRQDGPRVIVTPHELGGIAVHVRGADGTTVTGRVNIPEAALVAANIQALITMAFGTAYQQAAEQEAALRNSNIVVPGR